METQTYNGWTNYATWRINLEFGLSDGAFDYDAEQLQTYVEEQLEFNCENEMTLSYALAFVSDVNWNEIVRHIEENKEEEV